MDGLITTAGQIFEIIDGCWQLHRFIKNTIVTDLEVDDYNFDTEWQGKGCANFFNTDIDGIRLYRENINLENVNTKLSIFAKQEYRYGYNKQSEVLTKYFSDGKVFYNLRFIKDIICGTYICINDQYESRYLFTDSKNFSIIYKVCGPKKNYTIISKYVRMY